MSYRNTRTRKQPVKNSAFSGSMTSLFSSITQASKSSSGSNSTITQDSLGKNTSSKHPVSKRSTGQSKRTSKREPSSHKSLDYGKKPNVFAFRVDDDEEEEERDVVGDLPSDSDVPSPPDLEDTESPPEPIMPVAPQPPISSKLPAFVEGFEQTIPARPLSFASLHSDSGISIRSSSPDRSSPVITQKSASKPYLEKTKARSRPMARGSSNSSVASSSSSSRPSPQTWRGTPESFYSSGSQPEPSPKSPTKQIIRRASISKKPSKVKSNKPTTKPPPQEPLTLGKGGYDLLASSLSTVDQDSPKPLYRRFEALNNRILLVLQDEITTMENDLSVMDHIIATQSLPGPTSRRGELQIPTQVQADRTVLYGRLMQQLGLYSKSPSPPPFTSTYPLPSTSFTDPQIGC